MNYYSAKKGLWKFIFQMRTRMKIKKLRGYTTAVESDNGLIKRREMVNQTLYTIIKG